MVPAPGAIVTDGLAVADDDMAELLRVDIDEWRAEVPSIEEHYAHLGERVPVALRDELAGLEKRLSAG
jgi:phosphoenolpyruvate carboxykinase (GTP)